MPDDVRFEKTSGDGDPRFPGSAGPASGILAEFFAHRGHSHISNKKEFKSEFSEFLDVQNTVPQEDFLGLTISEMDALLNAPFSFPGLLRVSEQVDPAPDLPVTIVLDVLRDACFAGKDIHLDDMNRQEGGLFEQIMEALETRTSLSWLLPDEMDPGNGSFMVANVLLSAFEAADIIQTTNNEISFAPKWDSDIRSGDYSRLYPAAFLGYSEKIDWSIWGIKLPALFQRFLGFSLYQLAINGTSFRNPFSFGKDFYRAFPQLVPELVPNKSGDAAQMQACSRYVYGLCLLFWRFMGLTELQLKEPRYSNDIQPVRASPLFNQLISFPKIDERAR